MRDTRGCGCGSVTAAPPPQDHGDCIKRLWSFPFNRVAKQVSSQQSGGPLGIATPDPSIKIQFPIFVFGVWRPATDRAKAIKEPASDAIWHLGKGNPHLLYMAHRTNIHTYISLRRRKSAPEEQINKIQTFPPSQKGEMQNFTR